jgi:hypothetical protein
VYPFISVKTLDNNPIQLYDPEHCAHDYHHHSIRKGDIVMRRLGRSLGLRVAVLCLVTALATAPTMTGTVTKIDDTGMATVKTANGTEHKVTEAGWTVGAQVACQGQEGQTVCTAM